MPNPSPSPTAQAAIGATLLRSSFVRLLLLGGLALLLQVPIALIGNTIAERRTLRNEAVSEVSGKWGRRQLLQGPTLVVPFMRHEQQIDRTGKQVTAEVLDYARFLPRRLQVDGKLTGEERYRGIFRIPVYRARLHLVADFAPPDFSHLAVPPDRLQWDRAYLSLPLSDPRALDSNVVLRRGARRLPFQPSAGEYEGEVGGIHLPLNQQLASNLGRVTLDLTFRGSISLDLAPVGETTVVDLSSSGLTPSFTGAWLPTSRQVARDGFRAHWSVPAIGRDYPQAWVGHRFDGALDRSCLGVDLIAPVDPYRMGERSQKYQVLFICLTFLTLWMFEVLAGCRIHLVQYLLVGSALCLFCLLEIALAEHLGFGLAYLLTASIIAALITCYSATVLRRKKQSLALAAVVGGLYAYLYAVLSSENYALLAGALALLAALATVMFLTRRVDWSQLGQQISEAVNQPIDDPVEQAFDELERREQL